MGREVVENAASVSVGGQEDAGAGSSQAVPQGDRLRGVGCCQDGHLGVHLEQHPEVRLEEHLEVHPKEHLGVRPEEHLGANLPG